MNFMLHLLWPAVLAGCLSLQAQTRVLYDAPSPYNTIIVTEDESGVRTLQFERGGARQSVVKPGDPRHLELPYLPAMLVSLAAIESPRRILIVGLGGGSLPTFLHLHYPEAVIDVVDIDPDVVKVAKLYFGFQEDANLRAQVADGRGFIEAVKEPYDLILLDAYGSDRIPYHLATAEFLRAVRRALSSRGLVAGNIWGRTSNPLYDSMVRTYAEVFPRVCLLDVSGAGNIIVLASPRENGIERPTLLKRGSEISREKEFRFDLSALVRRGFEEARTRNSGGQVLTDQDRPPGY